MIEENLAILKENFPDVTTALNKEIIDKNYQIIESKNNSKTAIVNIDSKKISIHSKYNPQKEAERIVDQINLENLTSIVVFGFGLGYHILKLLDKLKDNNIKLFIIENNLFLFKEALKYNDFTKLFSYDKLYLLIKDNIKKYEIFRFVGQKIDFVFENVGFIELPGAVKYSSVLYKLFQEDMEELLNGILSTKATTIQCSKIWNNNLLNNFNLLINSPGLIELQNFCKDKPVILVAAGPSLNKNIDYLKEAKSKALIITVEAALKTLLAADIVPDIVCLLDGKTNMFRFFEGIDYDDVIDTVLVACPRVQPKILEDWSGPIVFAPSFNDVTEDYILKWLERYIGSKGRFFGGGSVSTLGFSLAYYLGGDPIAFVGQDLAFTDNYTHASGSAHRQTVDQDIKTSGKRFLEVEDINGEKVLTRQDFYIYLQWFNRTIRELRDLGSTVKFVDATEGGARIKGTELMRLEEFINEYCQEDIDINKELLKKIRRFIPEYKEELLVEFENLINNINNIKLLAENGLKLIDQLIDSISNDSDRTKELSSALAQINTEINQLKDNLIFFESEIYDIYFKGGVKLKSLNNIDAFNQFVEFYNKLINGATNTVQILEEQYQQLTKRGEIR